MLRTPVHEALIISENENPSTSEEHLENQNISANSSIIIHKQNNLNTQSVNGKY